MRLPGPTHRNIYVRSERAGQRVMESVKRFITEKLKLKVNESKDPKSAGTPVGKPQERKSGTDAQPHFWDSALRAGRS